jgi:small subunit ribosomal protein S17
MAKQLTGTVVSNSMQNTIVVEVVRRTPHPLYRKLIKRSKKIKAETKGVMVELGARVIIAETKPLSKDKHFMLVVKEETK